MAITPSVGFQQELERKERMKQMEWCQRNGGKWNEEARDCKFPGEITPPPFEVHYEEATHAGFDEVDMKFFDTKPNAKRYANALLGRLEESAKISDDYESVVIQDDQGGTIEYWRAEEGEVRHYGG